MIRVIITDDHPIVRQGIRQILEDDADMRFGPIEEAANGNELLGKLSKSNFDVVLLDISLPGRSGLELLTDIKKFYPSLAVVMVTIYPEKQYAVRALKLGASGYITKSSAPEELIVAIVKASQGGRYITESLAQRITFELLSPNEKALHDNLSVRELEVIKHLTAGKTLNMIASELTLSPKTISTYRERILVKLNLKTTADIIRYGIENGLTDGQIN